MSTEKVCIVGSGNWGSAIARIVGRNAAAHDVFDSRVNMWVYEEEVEHGVDAEGKPKMRKLTEVINEEHENVKYLKGIKLPENVVAVPDLEVAAAGYTMFIFVLPHQFLGRLYAPIKKVMGPNSKAISLIKGFDFDEKGPALVSTMLREGLGVNVSVLMGANVANEVAQDHFCEATIGCDDATLGALWKKLFHAPLFQIRVVTDCVGVEICGALKNVVALGAGFSDAIGYGGNTKAAIIRIGLQEIIRFTSEFYGDSVQSSTFLESCGLADMITTCFGGRNVKCADAFVRQKKTWEEVERDLLGGQKLAGTPCCKELLRVLRARGIVDRYPLFRNIHAIAFEGAAAETLIQNLEPAE